MKYAVFLVADQTIVFVTPKHIAGNGPWEHTTTKHPEAMLWDSESDARDVVNDLGVDGRGLPLAYVEDVPDEAEFRAREDTW